MSQKQRTPPPLVDGPPSSQPPSTLSERAALAMGAAMVEYHAQFHDLFARREQREWSEFYLWGQLSGLERKTSESMVLALKPHAGSRSGTTRGSIGPRCARCRST